MNTITARSLELFLEYAEDAPSWNGNPLVGGNVGGSKEDRGNLTQLKRAGLVETFKAYGLFQRLHPSHVYGSVQDAIAAFEASQSQPTT